MQNPKLQEVRLKNKYKLKMTMICCREQLKSPSKPMSKRLLRKISKSPKLLRLNLSLSIGRTLYLEISSPKTNMNSVLTTQE